MRDDRDQVALALQQPGELGEVGLQPVLRRVLLGRLAQVDDHLVDVVLERRDLARRLDRRSTARDRPWSRRSRPRRCARTCVVRLAASRLTLSVRSRQVPAAPGTLAWPPSLPSIPTSRATVVTCSAKVRQRVDHAVDGVGELLDLALGLEHELALQVAVGDRR